MPVRVLSFCVFLSAMLGCVVPVHEDPPFVEPPICELLHVDGQYGGELRPSEDLAIECDVASAFGSSLAVNDAGVLLCQGTWDAPTLWIADGGIDIVETPENFAWAEVVATSDDGLHLLGGDDPNVFDPELIHVALSGNPPTVGPSASFAELYLNGVAAHGEVLHVWGSSDGGTIKAHLTLTDGTWEEQGAPYFPDGYEWEWGIDGAGHQLGYAFVYGDVYEPAHIWATDGEQAWSLGESNMAGELLRSVPPAVPARAADSHLLAIHGTEGIVLLRPQPGGADRIAIPGTLPAEPESICDGVYCQANTICTTFYRGAAIDLFDFVRSADGRLWLAWVEQDLRSVERDYDEDCWPQSVEITGVETVHLAEISLADGSVVAELSFEQSQPTDVLLASHGDRLVLAVAEDHGSRWRILSLDLS